MGAFPETAVPAMGLAFLPGEYLPPSLRFLKMPCKGSPVQTSFLIIPQFYFFASLAERNPSFFRFDVSKQKSCKIKRKNAGTVGETAGKYHKHCKFPKKLYKFVQNDY